jgi:prepilin-type N-terminal cleavage/methylation domain-containing protein/prepilin-type processing-associated H-X9-DG protein
MKTQKKGFTLIELLVVISIIALLVSILLPALSGAREQARMAVCAVHISGMGKAVVVYTTDSKDILPTQGLTKVDKTPVVPYLDNQMTCNYYPYWEAGAYGVNAGPSEVGCLYLTGAIENMSNIVFCPSYRGQTLAGYSGVPNAMWGRGYDAWNSRGDRAHGNYTGINPLPSATWPYQNHVQYYMTDADNAKIGWLNSRISYGVRPMFNLKVKSISKLGSSSSYISDVWEANNSYNATYRMHIDEFSHASKGSTEAKVHVWYADGHVERRTLAREKYFVAYSQMSSLPIPEGGFMNIYPALTWRVLYEDGIEDIEPGMIGRPYDFTQAK